MKLTPFFLLMASAVLFAQSTTKQSAPEKEVLEVEQKYNAAYAANDLPAYFSYLAPDFTQWLPGGRTDKEQYQTSWTRFIQNGGKVLSADFTDMVIQVSPAQDSAVASYLLHVVTHSARGDSDEYFQESDVLFHRDGEWKLVHLNYAPARKKKAQ
jgi:ketosteroid isomerase-like protein